MRAKSIDQHYLFIVGCQRSGTTMLSEILEKDLNTRTYGEASELSYDDSKRRLRLRPVSYVKKELQKNRASLIVMKPLVESQNTAALLHNFEDSKAVWIYRNFRDVALSNVGRFGQENGIDDLRPIIEMDADNWRSEKLSGESSRLVQDYYSPTMNPYDAAVLFWIVRNNIYFETGLDTLSEVQLCRYEDLTRNPGTVMKRIYAFVDQEYPGDHIVAGTHTKSISKGAAIELTSEIDTIAKELLEKLDSIRGCNNGH